MGIGDQRIHANDLDPHQWQAAITTFNAAPKPLFGNPFQLVPHLDLTRPRHHPATEIAYGKLMDLEATPSVRRRMQRTRGRDNPFEVLIRSQLYAKGIRYRAHYPVPGMKRITCDIAVPKLRIAVFLDGCFWHGCDIHPPSVKKNTAFWMEKIERNRARDRRVREHLADIGWTTLRFWEHEAVEAIVRRIVSTVEEYRAAKPHPAAARARCNT